MKTHHTLLLAGILAIGMAAPSRAAEIGSDGPFGSLGLPGRPLRTLASAAVRHFLNFRNETPLSAEQKQAIAAIVQSHRDEIRSQVQKGIEARREMASVAEAQGADASATRAAAEKLGGVARDRALLAARILREVRPLLTPDQVSRIQSARTELESLADNTLASLPK